jgi:hypothetical protein
MHVFSSCRAYAEAGNGKELRVSIVAGEVWKWSGDSAFLTFRPHRFSTVAVGRSVGNIRRGCTRDAMQS